MCACRCCCHPDLDEATPALTPVSADSAGLGRAAGAHVVRDRTRRWTAGTRWGTNITAGVNPVASSRPRSISGVRRRPGCPIPDARSLRDEANDAASLAARPAPDSPVFPSHAGRPARPIPLRAAARGPATTRVGKQPGFATSCAPGSSFRRTAPAIRRRLCRANRPRMLETVLNPDRPMRAFRPAMA